MALVAAEQYMLYMISSAPIENKKFLQRPIEGI